MLETAATKKAANIIREDIEERKPWPHRFIAFFSGKKLKVVDKEKDVKEAKKGQKSALRKLRPDMIRRMDDAPKLLNPSGWVSEGSAPSREQSYNSTTGPRLKREVTIHPNTQTDSGGSSDSSKQAAREPVVIDFVGVKYGPWSSQRLRTLTDPLISVDQKDAYQIPDNPPDQIHRVPVRPVAISILIFSSQGFL